ncbi:MAG: UDP-3-O-(3-hydroxymyristoyl)glucosamine N-acyltransferase [bacterium]|nr:UDP-3-O-(3-hydroxymyristoyl)glucosamine N-acyltransferase [bacterium]
MARLDMTLGELRELLGEGELAGDAEFLCRELRGLDDAGPEDLSFVKGRKQVAAALASKAGALLVPEKIDGITAHQLVLGEPFVALTRVLARIASEKRAREPGVDATAVVHGSAQVGERVYVGPGAVIDKEAVVGDDAAIHANAFVGPRCVVGQGCVIHPTVVLREDVTLGSRVTVRSGSVLGSEGYGFLPTEGTPVPIPQVGGVEVGDDVEIGALATIDSATFGRTTIGEGSKIGDMVHVGHNCKIGKNVMLLPLTAISGSVKIGDGVIFAGRSGAADNLEIGAGARIGATAVVFKDVPEGVELWGSPARGKVEAMRIESLLGRLPELFRRVKELSDRGD